MGYWFWFFVLTTNPSFLLLGVTGILGKDAEEAAGDVGVAYAIVFAIFLIVGTIYYLFFS